MEAISNIWNGIVNAMVNLPNIGITDVLDICIVAYLIYKIMLIIRNTRAWALFKGLLMILLVAGIAYVFKFSTVLWIISNTISVGIIAIVIIFQPELRTALEKIGTSNMFKNFFTIEEHNSGEKISIRTIDEIVTGAKQMADAKTGAIIVIEQDVKLGEYEVTGIKLNATVSSELLVNIFEKNTPLHDGAVMVRDNMITYATCYLPLSNNPTINKKFGTRHRAAIGISEISDAIVVVVSEETGAISIATNGELKQNIVREHLRNEIIASVKKEKKTRSIVKKVTNEVKGKLK
ncbi:MAG: diadenylate cyclase CdaA [Clostridia bacterium]|nr:diadenylate cyclase CdaA [Clostridia bacterium]